MKICLNTQNNNNINYKAGKVRVFSDFDKTFLPKSQKELKNPPDADFVIFIRNYFAKFKQFLDNTKEGINFSVTTGRTLGEFRILYEISRAKNYGIPIPDTVIVRNGGDEYIKVGTDEGFNNWGRFPFVYSKTNKEKEENIKKISGWDGQIIKKILQETYKSYGMDIVEGDSLHNSPEFRRISLFSRGLKNENNLLYEEEKLADWKVGFRNDGNCKIFVTEPFDMHMVEDRYNILLEINKKIYEALTNLNIKITTTEYSRGGTTNKCGGRPYHEYEPLMGCESTPEGNCCGLTKSYDVKEALKEAKKNNDLVIAAGDGENDYTMLNPFNMLEEDIKNLEITETEKSEILKEISNPQKMIEYLKQYPQLAKAYKKLPFMGIIVKSNANNLPIANLAKYLSDGKYRKLFIVDEGNLEDGIRNVIRTYCKNNPEFNGKLSADIRKEVMKHKKNLRNN